LKECKKEAKEEDLVDFKGQGEQVQKKFPCMVWANKKCAGSDKKGCRKNKIASCRKFMKEPIAKEA